VCAHNYELARELSGWKSQVRANWDAVRVDHVEADGIGDSVTLGSRITVRAYVSLGVLTPQDVEVSVVCGRVDSADRLASTHSVTMAVVEQYDGNRVQYSADVALDMNGSFGYTVRILPKHVGLVSGADLGLLSLPAPTHGMTDAVLR
jgi:starch phosphorylase